MNIILSSRFDRDYEQLIKKQPLIASRVHKTVKLLSTNPGHPSLRIHKLVGQDNYSISVTMSVRILFTRQGDTAYLFRIGTHEEVY